MTVGWSELACFSRSGRAAVRAFVKRDDIFDRLGVWRSKWAWSRMFD